MRHYVRLDPLLPDHKADADLGEDYPDGAGFAFILTLCWAARQSPPGYFRNRQVLAGLLGKRAKWIEYLIRKGDVVELEGGRLYVEGWNEWQEGQFPTVDARRKAIASRDRPLTPAERSAAYRARKKAERESEASRDEHEPSRDAERDASRDGADVTRHVTEGVTENVTRHDVTSRVTRHTPPRLDKAKPSRTESLSKENRRGRAGDDDERADVQALLDRGWKRVTTPQRAILDEVLDLHDVTGPAWAASIIAATPHDRDPLAAVKSAHSRWKAERSESGVTAEAKWEEQKRADRNGTPAIDVDGDFDFLGPTR